MNVLDAARGAIDLLASPVKHERAISVREHRPWPMPTRSWVMAQSWLDLLFAHWPVPAATLAPVVPRHLVLDTFDGAAWVAVTPFEVRNLRLRTTPPVPKASAFPEINVRTYVSVDGKPGIFFFSLDADSALAVAAARRFYRLPYFRARMTIRRTVAGVHYRSERAANEDSPAATFEARYRPVGAPSTPTAGSLEHWLTERYCLYTLDQRQTVLRGEIHHPPWVLHRAEAEIAMNTMAEELGLALEGDPLLHYACRQDVVFWSLEPVEG